MRKSARNTILLFSGCLAVFGMLAVLLWTIVNKERENPDGDTVEVSRTLQDGLLCRIWIVTSMDETVGVRKLRRLDMQLDGKTICFSAEMCKDVPVPAMPEAVQVADFAGDVFLLLAGEPGSGGWQAKWTIRNQQVVEREYVNDQGERIITCYPPVPELRDAGFIQGLTASE